MPTKTDAYDVWRKEFVQCVRHITSLTQAVNALAAYKNENIVLMRAALQRDLKEWMRVRDNMITEVGAGLWQPDTER